MLNWLRRLRAPAEIVIDEPHWARLRRRLPLLDGMDASDLARAVCDIEGDIRAIAARFCASSASTSASLSASASFTTSPFAAVRSVACHLDGRRCTAAVRVALVAGAPVDVPAVARAAAALRSQLKAGVFDLDEVTVDIDLCALDTGAADARQDAASSAASFIEASTAVATTSVDAERASPIVIAAPTGACSARRVVAAEHRSSLVEPLSPDAFARLRPVVVWKAPVRFSDTAVAAAAM